MRSWLMVQGLRTGNRKEAEPYDKRRTARPTPPVADFSATKGKAAPITPNGQEVKGFVPNFFFL